MYALLLVITDAVCWFHYFFVYYFLFVSVPLFILDYLNLKVSMLSLHFVARVLPASCLAVAMTECVCCHIVSPSMTL